MMLKQLTILMSLFLIAGLTGCSSSKVSTPGESEAADTSDRPEWTMNEPGVEDEKMYFVGISSVHVSEKNARDDARRNSVNAAIQYLGTMAKSKFEQAQVTYGLASEAMDPTTSARQYEKQVAANVTRRLKAEKWYMERETDASGKRGYKYFVLAGVPVKSLDEAFQQTAKKNMKDAQKRAKEAATEQAKRQQEQAAEFWSDMQKQGVTTD
jgi:hypothetical protein|tara:strand:+ start:148 stop:780 length:633 start_codon:yes stop_codon:yes gene_type:complete